MSGLRNSTSVRPGVGERKPQNSVVVDEHAGLRVWRICRLGLGIAPIKASRTAQRLASGGVSRRPELAACRTIPRWWSTAILTPRPAAACLLTLRRGHRDLARTTTWPRRYLRDHERAVGAPRYPVCGSTTRDARRSTPACHLRRALEGRLAAWSADRDPNPAAGTINCVCAAASALDGPAPAKADLPAPSAESPRRGRRSDVIFAPFFLRPNIKH